VVPGISVTFITSMQQSTLANGKKRKTTMLKELIQSKELEFMMEAHSGLSARIVQEAGFKSIWASGFAISAQLGVRDCNEASWTQVLEICDFMADATDIPILFDADTGFGNFNNARRMVRKLEQIGIAGCCIEDKPFPKCNALLEGRKAKLADIDEMALKIKACKDTQSDPDFVVIARSEAFIAGYPVEEVLRRAEAFDDAGADAIFIHSKNSGPDDIVEFMKVWKRKTPVVVCPSKYYRTPPQQFRELGVSLVIWGNYTVRASVTAMQEVCAQMYRDQHAMSVIDKVASAAEVFRLQREEELVEAERKYLPKK